MTSVSLPAPVGGWNARDAQANMAPNHAVLLENWFPSTDAVELRPSYEAHATGLPAVDVETLIDYVAPDGTPEVFACVNGAIYDVTAAGAVGGPVASGFSNSRFQHVQITTAGGHFVIAMNGADAPQEYDGASWAAASIAGPTATALVWCNVHQRRLWVGEAGSLSAWYLDVNAKGGAALEFPLGALARLGGYVVGMETWTRDSGEGQDDVAVFLTSEGEAIVYAGTDPNSVSTWALQGVFRIGRPIGRRCTHKVGGDLLILTEDGLVSLTQALRTDRTQVARAAVSDQIRGAFNAAVRSFGSAFGWQIVLYPRKQMLIANVPQLGARYDQFVFNMITGAPCRFKGIPANSWGRFGERLLIGGRGVVYAFDAGSGDDGSSIVAEAQTAYSYFGSPGRRKFFNRVELILQSEGAPTYGVDMFADFEKRAAQHSAVVAAQSTASATWGNALWGVGRWGTSQRLYDGWNGVNGQGFAGSLRLTATAASNRVRWFATNYTFTPAGPL